MEEGSEMKTHKELFLSAEEVWKEIFGGHNVQNISRKQLAMELAVSLTNREVRLLSDKLDRLRSIIPHQHCSTCNVFAEEIKKQ
jgi:hypothetical protein